jgi:hypothetical protein
LRPSFNLSPTEMNRPNALVTGDRQWMLPTKYTTRTASPTIEEGCQLATLARDIPSADTIRKISARRKLIIPGRTAWKATRKRTRTRWNRYRDGHAARDTGKNASRDYRKNEPARRTTRRGRKRNRID